MRASALCHTCGAPGAELDPHHPRSARWLCNRHRTSPLAVPALPRTTKREGRDRSTRERTPQVEKQTPSPVQSFEALSCSTGKGDGGRVIDFARHAREVARALRMSGVRDACPLPGHSGAASVELRGGRLRLTCGCPEGRGWTALSDAFAAVKTGGTRQRMTKQGRWLWTLLLAHHAGLLEPVEVRLGPMPRRTTPRTRAVAEDIRLLKGLWLAAGDTSPVPYSCSLAMQRCGLANNRQANAEIRKLLGAGTITNPETRPNRGARWGAATTGRAVERRPPSPPGRHRS
jgi:hypothetical protein